ncbi:reverse transcriptase [Tanacetum coccineum]
MVTLTLPLAYNHGWVGAIVESDSQLTISLSSTETIPPWSLGSLIEDIRTWSKNLHLTFSWTNRSNNQVAHWTAQFTLSSNQCITWDVSFPTELTSLSMSDMYRSFINDNLIKLKKKSLYPSDLREILSLTQGVTALCITDLFLLMNETDARISSIYAASVARIQRSKSRHKALKQKCPSEAGKHNDRILVLLMPPSDKLVDAVETSQRLSEGVTKGVLKPCCSSSYTVQCSLLVLSWFPSPYARHQKVSKQLNFNEIEECDFDETCSPLSKKRKMDGFESASSVDHKPISPFFERQSLIANVLSSSPKAADTLSDNNFDERINDETTNLGLETDENLVGGDVEDNSKISVYNNIIDATCDTSLKEVTTIVDEEKYLIRKKIMHPH